MLTLHVVLKEGFDQEKREFVTLAAFDLNLEHSLVSLSKWESHFEKPFLGKAEKTPEEVFWYVKAMALDDDVPEEVFLSLNEKHGEQVNEYIQAKMTATWFSNQTPSRNKEIITAEVIYYWMIQLNINWEAQYWHLNRLLTLIQVCNQKSTPPKKMSPSEAARRQHELNEQRRKMLGTSG